jgi:hypothetical protein
MLDTKDIMEAYIWFYWRHKKLFSGHNNLLFEIYYIYNINSNMNAPIFQHFPVIRLKAKFLKIIVPSK